MSRQVDIFEFYHASLEPLLESRLGDVFSDFSRSKSSGRWYSPLYLDGSRPDNYRPDKCYTNVPSRAGKQCLRVSEQGGRKGVDIIELLEIREHLDNVAAVKEIAKRLGVRLEEEDPTATSRALKRRETQKKLQAALQEMKAALYAPQGAQVLEYLKGTDKKRGQRGYSDSYIESAPIGYFDMSLECYEELSEILYYRERGTDKEKGLRACSFVKYVDPVKNEKMGIGAGYTHCLAIAYLADGEIKGFKFRAIASEGDLQALADKVGLRKIPKYYAAFLSEADTQGSYPICLPSGKLSSYSDKYFNFTLVEGELDTYRGNYAGVPNVVGLGEGSLTQAQVEHLKAKGAKRVTIVKDTEPLLKADGSSNFNSIKTNREAVASAINLLYSQGLDAFAFYLPASEDPKEKVDIDDYFFGLEGDALKARASELQEMIKQAEGGYTFLYRKAQEECKEAGGSRADLDILLKQARDLKLKAGAIDRANINRLLKKYTGLDLSNEDRALTPEEEAKESARKTAQNALQKQIKRAGEQLPTDSEKALQTLKAEIVKFEEATLEQNTEALREKYRKVESWEARAQRRANKRKGIPTDFTLKAKIGTEEERLILPAGAITYVCFPTSHGKTRLLENLAIQLLLNEQEQGSVLFYSVEEDSDSILDEMLNIYYTLQNVERPQEILIKAKFLEACKKTYLQANNLRAIRSYFSERDPSEKYSSFRGKGRGTEGIEKARKFEESLEAFYSYIGSEKLKVEYIESRSSDTIVEAAKFLASDLRDLSPSRPIKAIFIDYIQRLKKRGNFGGSRKEELTAVTNDLMSLAIELQVPIVVAVQLSREAYSPLEIDLQTIADAAEIEQSGNLVILGWNSSFPARVKSTSWWYKSKEKKMLTEEAQAFINCTGIEPGKAGDIYLLAGKNRGGLRDIETRLYFDGKSGLMIQGERYVDTARRLGLPIPSRNPSSSTPATAPAQQGAQSGAKANKNKECSRPPQESEEEEDSDLPF